MSGWILIDILLLVLVGVALVANIWLLTLLVMESIRGKSK